jgi:hypothetical protein
VNGLGPNLQKRPAARLARQVVIFHLILGPWGACIIAYDSRHPELWVEEWFRNPHLSIPLCICLEFVLWAVLWRHLRKERRMAKGIRLLTLATRLLAEGEQDAADAA